MALHAQEEEFYVITWDAKKETIFEMPTGGAALMRSGKNLLKLARKEQCLALLCAPRGPCIPSEPLVPALRNPAFLLLPRPYVLASLAECAAAVCCGSRLCVFSI